MLQRKQATKQIQKKQTLSNSFVFPVSTWPRIQHIGLRRSSLLRAAKAASWALARRAAASAFRCRACFWVDVNSSSDDSSESSESSSSSSSSSSPPSDSSASDDPSFSAGLIDVFPSGAGFGGVSFDAGFDAGPAFAAGGVFDEEGLLLSATGLTGSVGHKLEMISR